MTWWDILDSEVQKTAPSVLIWLWHHSNAAPSLADSSLSSHYAGPTNQPGGGIRVWWGAGGRRSVSGSRHVWHLCICAALEHLVPILYFIAGLFGNLVVFLSKRWRCLGVFFFLPPQQRVNGCNCSSSTCRFVLTEHKINKGKGINSDSRHN